MTDLIIMSLLVLIAFCILLFILFFTIVVVHWMFNETPLLNLILFIILVWLAVYIFIEKVSVFLVGRF